MSEMRDINNTSRGNALAPYRRNSLSCTVRRLPDKRLCNQMVGCQLCSMGRINDLWDGTSAKCVDLVPCCGQDGYQDQDQVPQHPTASYRYISLIIHNKNWKFGS